MRRDSNQVISQEGKTDAGCLAMKKPIQSFRDLPVYQDAFALQQAIFEHTKRWPREEMFSLIDQVRRSSRGIGANIAEAWAKRRYKAHFISKLTDADAELQETLHWLALAEACKYVDAKDGMQFTHDAQRVGRQIGAIMNDADRFCS